jgi:HEAT repeat protein
MMWLDTLLIGAAALAALAWLALAAYLLVVQRRRERTRTTLNAVMTVLEQPLDSPLQTRLETLRPVVETASRELLMRCAIEPALSERGFETIVALLAERWPMDTLVADAGSHSEGRAKWRRMTALRILSRIGHPQATDLLATAAQDADLEVAECGLSLLGQSADPGAGARLLAALTSSSGPLDRVAVHLDQSPLDFGSRLVFLLDHERPEVRRWAATLLARYPRQENDGRLARLTTDTNPDVRKAAIQTLAATGSRETAARAARLLHDNVPYVRAHAARALGEIGCIEQARSVTALLGDSDWWVRFAARESLELMGAEVWPVLLRCLDDPDRFVRNGAAEVMQNLGVLDNLILLEAATDYPASAKLDMLRRITSAGGIRLTASLIERSGPELGPRVRMLLDSIGLEYVGAA